MRNPSAARKRRVGDAESVRVIEGSIAGSQRLPAGSAPSDAAVPEMRSEMRLKSAASAPFSFEPSSEEVRRSFADALEAILLEERRA
jgi:hypothetical protein